MHNGSHCVIDLPTVRCRRRLTRLCHRPSPPMRSSSFRAQPARKLSLTYFDSAVLLTLWRWVGTAQYTHSSAHCSLQFACAHHVATPLCIFHCASVSRAFPAAALHGVPQRATRAACGGELVGVPQYVCFALLCFALQHAVHVRRVPVDARANGHGRLVR